jgi:hypothetical protein
MRRNSFFFAAVVLMVGSGIAAAQSPLVLYTDWPTAPANPSAPNPEFAEWVAGSSGNTATLSTSTPGQLTITEMGDELNPLVVGGAHVIRDGFNKRMESSAAWGGLDVYGLNAIEIDLSHSGTGTVNIQFFLQATPSFNYVWAGSDGTFGGPDFAVGPGLQTLRFPLSLLTPEQQTYIRTIGLSVRGHAAAGNVTWNLYEVRTVGPSATSRVLASHNAGTSDAGLNGAYVNFEQNAVVGNDGGQNQTGLTQVTNGTVGSLQWTDRGNAGNTANPSGAAISWGNGTSYNGNSFNERLSDFSNYSTLTFRMSATDPLNAGGSVGVQAWFQTGEYGTSEAAFQTTSGGGVGSNGDIALPIDGQYHDIVFPLANVTNRQNVQVFGLNLFSHLNDLMINVDLVRFDQAVAVPGDYNNNGVVDAGDYVLWRKGGPLANEVDTPGTVNQADYTEWRARFGNPSGSGTVAGTTIPEPAGMVLLISALLGPLTVVGRRTHWSQST